jgi:hypothetical protein
MHFVQRTLPLCLGQQYTVSREFGLCLCLIFTTLYWAMGWHLTSLQSFFIRRFRLGSMTSSYKTISSEHTNFSKFGRATWRGYQTSAWSLSKHSTPILRWVISTTDNIRMDLGEVGWSDAVWIGLAQDRNRWRALVNSVLNLRVPWNAGKLSSGLTSSGLSSSAQLHRVS